MAKKPFTVINEKLGEILEMLREIRQQISAKITPARSTGDTVLVVVSKSHSPIADREYVIAPAEVSVGDVVAYDGCLRVKGIQGLGIVMNIVDPASVLDCKNPGRAYAVWKGPTIPYDI